MDDGRSLGLMIRGGAEYALGIYITGVDKGSAAECGGLKVLLYYFLTVIYVRYVTLTLCFLEDCHDNTSMHRQFFCRKQHMIPCFYLHICNWDKKKASWSSCICSLLIRLTFICSVDPQAALWIWLSAQFLIWII